jgi:glycosyltransferase involved in cell wall biosynthesis
MNIGINATALSHVNPTGVEKYSLAIIEALIKAGQNDNKFTLYSPVNLPENFSQYQKVIKAKKLWTQVRLPIELMLQTPDVFFQPSYMLPLFCPCPSVITIHDLAWIHFPMAYSQEQIRSQQITLSRAKRLKSEIIVPSNATKVDCVNYGGFAANKIHVIAEASIKLPEANFDKYPNLNLLKDKKIILAIGRFETRKNQITLIKALYELAKNHKLDIEKTALVLIGKPGVGANDFFTEVNKAKSIGLNIIISTNTTDEEISCWFKVATLFVYPSLYEGFGLPVLQAFEAKIPVICSRNSSITEVAGDAAWYINNPTDENELAVGINALLNDSSKQNKLINSGNLQLNKFSWQLAANQTLAVLKLAHKSKKS